jgi:hypothetical protein
MSITASRVIYITPALELNISIEDFHTMMDMYELITNNYYHSDFCMSNEKGETVVGNLSDQIKDESHE